MQKDKRYSTPILIYFAVLIIFVTYNIIVDRQIVDLLYLVVVVSCVIKYFIVLRRK